MRLLIFFDDLYGKCSQKTMIDKTYDFPCNVFIDYNDEFRNALFVNKIFQTYLETFSSKIKIVHYY